MNLEKVIIRVVIYYQLLYLIDFCNDMLFFVNVLKIITFRELMILLLRLEIRWVFLLIMFGTRSFGWRWELTSSIFFLKVTCTKLRYLNETWTLVTSEYVEVGPHLPIYLSPWNLISFPEIQYKIFEIPMRVNFMVPITCLSSVTFENWLMLRMK